MRTIAILGLLAALVLGTTTIRAEDERPALHEHPTLLKMLFRNNELRRQIGLRPQRISPELTKAAQDHANYMATTGSFSHYTNGGPFARAIKHRFFGQVRENIAVGQGSVQNVFGTWKNSGAHYASIVSDAPEAGFGYAIAKGGTPYWVAVYGYPPAKPAVAKTPAASSAAVAKVPPAPDGSVAKTPAATNALVAKPASKVTTVLKPIVPQVAAVKTYSTGGGRRLLFWRR